MGRHVPTSFCGCWGRVGADLATLSSREGDRRSAGCRAAVWKSWCRNGADLEPPSQLLGR